MRNNLHYTLEELERAWERTKGETVKFDAAFSATERASGALKAWLETPEDERGRPPVGYSADGPLPKFRWRQTVEDIIGTAYWQVHDWLGDLQRDESVKREEVRFVFWFDK